MESKERIALENLEKDKYKNWQNAVNLYDNLMNQWDDFMANYPGHEKAKEKELIQFRSQLKEAHSEETKMYNEWMEEISKLMNEPEPERP